MTTLVNLPYTFHSDPGHGWMAVPIDEITPEIASKISHYSYTDGTTAYLEEDMDAATFLRAKYGDHVGFSCPNQINHADDAFIRNLPRWA